MERENVSRREFLKIAGIAGATVGAAGGDINTLIILLALFSCGGMLSAEIDKSKER